MKFIFSDIAVNAIVEMAENFARRRHRTCITDYLEHTVPMYTNREFVMHYRLKRTLVMNIVDRFNYWPHFRNLDRGGKYYFL